MVPPFAGSGLRQRPSRSDDNGRVEPGFVVVSGPAASGKTSLARALATELDLPLLAKDTIKSCCAPSTSHARSAPSSSAACRRTEVKHRHREINAERTPRQRTGLLRLTYS